MAQARAAVLAAKTDIVRAEGQRDAARIALDFQKELLDKKVGQKAKVEEAEFLVKAAEAAVAAAEAKKTMAEGARDEAQLGLDKCVVRAPASGVILKRDVHLGQMVGPQLPTPLFQMASNLSEVEVRAQIAEGDVSKVQAGQTAVFTVYPYADANIKFEGRVKRVDNLPNTFQGAVYYNAVIQVVNRREAPTRETWMRVGGILSSTPLQPAAGLPWMYLRDEDPWMLRPCFTATVDVVPPPACRRLETTGGSAEPAARRALPDGRRPRQAEAVGGTERRRRVEACVGAGCFAKSRQALADLRPHQWHGLHG